MASIQALGMQIMPLILELNRYIQYNLAVFLMFIYSNIWLSTHSIEHNRNVDRPERQDNNDIKFKDKWLLMELTGLMKTSNW